MEVPPPFDAGCFPRDGGEVCNGVDDDCDGLVDEGLATVCQNACGLGWETCSEGQLTCSAPKSTTEVCDGRDNDCNQVVDDVDFTVDGGSLFCYTGPARTVGNGPCLPGIWKCKSAYPYSQFCAGEVTPIPEICDGIDNDCNGLVDDMVGCSPPKELKVTLTWDALDDMDLHLHYPNQNFDPDQPLQWMIAPNDCFYGDSHPTWDMRQDESPSLDQDDLFGPGPEHITIQKMNQTDIYWIAVHLYSWKNSPNPVDATVKVECGGVLITTQVQNFDYSEEFWIVGSVQYSATQGCIFTPDNTKSAWGAPH